MTEERQITLCLTSCGRFDLLRRTLQSFFRHSDRAIETCVIAEDSGEPDAEARLREIIQDLPKLPFRLLAHQTRIGQIASIDRAYAEIQTPYIFHCEDDWEFLKGGFMTASLELLETHAEAVMVWLRDPLDVPGSLKSMTRLAARQRCYDVSKASADYILNFNPGLRRLADYRAIGSYEKLSRGEGEGAPEKKIGRFYDQQKRRLFLLGGGPYCRHIGARQTMTRTDPSRSDFRQARRGRARFMPRFMPRLYFSLKKRFVCLAAYLRLWRLGDRPTFVNLLNHLR